MEFFKIKKDIPFMKHAIVFNAISFITFLAAVFFLFSRGLHLSVEFTGGTLMEVQQKAGPADLAKMRSTLSGLGLGEVQLQQFGTPSDVLIRVASANTGSSVVSSMSDAVVTGHAHNPLGRHSSEPRCDMPANAKPPLP